MNEICPYCGHPHGKTEYCKLPLEVKRKRRPYKNIDPTNPEQVRRQIAKYMPGWKLIRDE